MIMFMLAISIKSGREADEENLHFLSRRPEKGVLSGYCFNSAICSLAWGVEG